MKSRPVSCRTASQIPANAEIPDGLTRGSSDLSHLAGPSSAVSLQASGPDRNETNEAAGGLPALLSRTNGATSGVNDRSRNASMRGASQRPATVSSSVLIFVVA
ncbi:unnamed protein product [Protopolystoma xenopodis]|uniref:Uncharacterized protein n=1 Tax=Protopolystoma xenopodis TaxID=117903 RepID=A0A3S5A8Q5_9PLAT|nr:unnamed protein product [Protopolystoma xenopodis]